MKKRMLLMLLAITLFVTAVGLIKFFQIRAAIAQGASWQPPPEAVTTIVASQEQWPASLKSIGTVVAVHGVTVSADLPGIVERITFESGQRARVGEVLVRLDTGQEQAQLASAQAAEHLAQLNFQRMRDLRERGVTSEAEFDRFSAEAGQAEAKVGEIRATIERKTIRAPFSGVLGIRQVDLGEFLNGGDPVVPLQSLDQVYVNFALPQQELPRVTTGTPVGVALEGDSLEFTGRVTAINSVIDEATRNVDIQATFDNPSGRLHPGMFVEVRLLLEASSSSVALPVSAVNYAPYGNSVFIVEEMKGPDGKPYRGVRQQFVELGEARGDLVAILSGVKAGEEVVTSGVFKLRNGAAVQVNNEVTPSSSASPRPEDS
jgi:membrane fusion protein (multidrug efflux system)